MDPKKFEAKERRVQLWMAAIFLAGPVLAALVITIVCGDAWSSADAMTFTLVWGAYLMLRVEIMKLQVKLEDPIIAIRVEAPNREAIPMIHAERWTTSEAKKE